MPMTSVYVKDTDQPIWDRVAEIAKRRSMSTSALLSEILDDWARKTQSTKAKEMGLPPGFQVPPSMLDPEEQEREELAADIAASVMKILRDREVRS